MSVATQDIRAVLIQTETRACCCRTRRSPRCCPTPIRAGGERAGLAARPDPLARLAPAVAGVRAVHRAGRRAARPGQQGGGAQEPGGEAALPFFALLTKGFPRLVSVSRDALVAGDAGEAATVQGVRAYVQLNDETVAIPDIDGIEQAILQATAA